MWYILIWSLSCGVKQDDKTDGISRPSRCCYSLKDLQKSDDKDLLILLSWLKEGKKTKERELFLTSPAAKYYWLNKQMFEMVDEVLFRNKKKTRGSSGYSIAVKGIGTTRKS